MSRAASQAAARPAAPEQVVARLRRHARVLALPAVLLIAVAGAAGYAMAVVAEWWLQLVVVGIALVVVVAGCLVPFLAWLSQRTTVTTRRVIVRRGVFVRVRQELVHARGYDIVVRRSWAQRALGSGDVRLDSGHDHPIVLRDLPDPILLQAALHELMAHEQHSDADHRWGGGSSVERGVGVRRGR